MRYRTLHPDLINVVVFHGSKKSYLEGGFRLDAFSGYPVHT